MNTVVFMQVKEIELTSECFNSGLLWDIYDASGLMWFYVLQFEA